jgi:hypothetical protein
MAMRLPMSRVYGHGADFNVPLGVLQKSQEAMGAGNAVAKEVTQRYEQWLANSPFRSKICFVDLTFAPVGAERSINRKLTLIVGSSEAQRFEYERRLESFLNTPASLAAHPVFIAGLPQFVDTQKGELRFPETSEELKDCRKSETCRLQDDGLCIWRHPYTVEASAMAEEPTCADPADYAFSASLERTFKNIENRLEEIPPTLTDNWNRYIMALTAPGPPLRSAGDSQIPALNDLHDLGLIVAAPLGTRAQSSKKFYPVADVFFGLNRLATGEDADAFLRFLAVHLLKVNAGFNQQVRADQRLAANLGHELKKVAVTFTDGWAPRAQDIFDVRVATAGAPLFEDPALIGSIELRPEFAFLKNQLGILPFRDQVRVAAKSIRFWSYADRATDQPFPDSFRFPKDWAELINACWETARDQIALYALSNRAADSAESIKSLHGTILDLKTLCSCQRPQVQWLSETQIPRCYFDRAEGHTASFVLARVLVALFGNCLQHGALFSPVQVSVEEILPEQYRFVIENKLRESDGKIPNTIQLSQTRVSELLQMLNSDSVVADATKQLEGSTSSVVQFALRDLGEYEPEPIRKEIASFTIVWKNSQ